MNLKPLWLGIALWCLPGALLAAPPEPETLSPLWSVRTQAPFNLAPQIQQDLVLVASGATLWAIEWQSGKVSWTYTPEEGLWERSFATSGQLVWIGLRDRSLVALDLKTGQARWRRQFPLHIQFPPLWHEDALYVVTTRIGEPLERLGDPSLVVALEARSGTLRWEQETLHYAVQTPVFSEGVLYLGGSYLNPEVKTEEGGPMAIVALEAQSGTPLWETRGEDGFVKAIHAYGDRLAYVAYQDFLVGLNATDGTPLWRRDTGNWVPSLTGREGVVFLGAAHTRIYAFEMSDGTRLWEHDIPWGAFNYLMGAPTLSGDRLYGLTQRGHLFALSITTGESLWSKSTGKTSRVAAAFAPGVAIVADEAGQVTAFAIPE
ncbi:MAG: PQQ-binding-like beta-propeller repeat protein [bacterium]